MAQQRRSRDEWQALAREQRRSKLGVAEFARSRGIRPRTFAWWLWRLGSDPHHPKRKAPRRERVRMLPVSVLAPSRPEPQARIEVSIGSLSVRLTADSDPSYVAALVRQLRDAGC